MDVLVLGGGASGCALAARLSEDPGCEVCLVEAGPDYGPRSAWPRELLDPAAIPESHDWRDADASLPWARVLGGCSAHNACAVTRGPASDYDAWGEGWDWATLEPCMTRARDAIGARARNLSEVGDWHAGIMDAAIEAGLPRIGDVDEERAGIGVVATNVVDGARNNAALAYLTAARERPNLTILADSLVDRVVIEQGRAVGAVVRGAGGERTLRADRVVLAAGAYGSPAILLRSGIGPEDELRAHGIEPLQLLPVGEGLADHPRAGVGFSLRRPLPAQRGDRAMVAQTMGKWRSSRAGAAGWDVHLLAIVPSAGTSARVTAGLVAPRSRGRVGLRSRDPERLPRVEHGFLSDPEWHDATVLAEAIEWVRGLAATRALRRVASTELDPGRDVDSLTHVRENATTYYHPTGTCALGAVVGPDTAVHGVERLHVADASIAPQPVRAGTYLTALAIGERTAELLRG